MVSEIQELDLLAHPIGNSQQSGIKSDSRSEDCRRGIDDIHLWPGDNPLHGRGQRQIWECYLGGSNRLTAHPRILINAGRHQQAIAVYLETHLEGILTFRIRFSEKSSENTSLFQRLRRVVFDRIKVFSRMRVNPVMRAPYCPMIA